MTMPHLDNLQDQHPACETLAFADLSTRMVLVSNTTTPLTREGLDALCAEAAMTFGPDDKPALGNTPSETVIIATAGQIRIYLRTIAAPQDALCCVCAPDVDMAAFVSDARACLKKISDAG
ncbi:hypothetical protein [Yoonia sp.]|uniref:hypothetical protein n=1 Tax=Yoonia sp. TaxID=2212373 RepID=UPI003A4E091F